MSEIIERLAVAGDGITVSLIVWRRFKRPMPGLVEQIRHDVQNSGDAALDRHLDRWMRD